MKAILYFLITVFILGILPLNIIHANQSVRLVIESSDHNISETMLKRSADIMSGRLNHAGITAFDIDIEPGRIILKIPEQYATDKVKNLLISKGRIEFRESVSQRLLLEGKDVESMKTVTDDSGNAIAFVQFKKEAVPLWTEATKSNLNKSILILLDNRLIYDPVVRETISNGSCQITGNFTAEELQYISILANNGELPADFRIVE